jgi:putative membrane protein
MITCRSEVHMSQDLQSDAPGLDDTDLIGGDARTDLASNRTSLALERTRMSSDRTLMSTLRTSLSLISFGFTIYQVLGKASVLLPHASETGRNLGLGMLVVGLATLVMGIASHGLFDRQLGRRRDRLLKAGLLRHAAHYHVTPTYVSALAVLVLGLGALTSIMLRVWT